LARAEQGELEAQSEVASLYFSGKGTEKDFDRAVQWAAKSLSGDGNKKPYAQAMYILIVHCMFDLPENYVGYSNYKNAAGWARSAARHGYYSPLGTMEIRCGYGRYKSKWRVLYWKLLGAIAPRWYPLRKRLRRLF
ncbi:MAG: hypothetical protein IJW89_02165, partial [Clostridia bacterium]|nr:hypothetical protein [Clostridia bacterium]